MKGDRLEETTGDQFDGQVPQPRSDAQNYGRHIDTEHGQAIHRMQMKFESGFRRKPMSKEIGLM